MNSALPLAHMPMQTAVIAFVVDAQMDAVLEVNDSAFPNFATPYPFIKDTFPSFTITTDIPGVFHKGMEALMYLSNSVALSGGVLLVCFCAKVCEHTKRRRRDRL